MFGNILKVGGKLHKKIFLMMLFIGMVPVLVAGSFAFYSVTISHRESVASIEANLIKQKEEEIKRYIIDNGLNTIQLNLSTTELEKEFGPVSREAFLDSLMASNPYIEDSSFIDGSFLGDFGHEISRRSLEFSKLGEEPLLRDFNNLDEFKIPCSPNGEECSKEGSQNYISPVKSKVSGSVITLSAPVKNILNNIVAVWVADLNLSGLQKIVNTSALGKTGYVYIVDQGGRVIANSKTADGKGLRTNLSDVDIVARVIKGESFLNSEARQRYDSVFGEQVVAAAAPIKMGSSTWGIVSEWPAKEADLVLENLLRQITIFSAFALLGVIILSAVLASKIVRPIQQLEASTEAVAKGKFDEPVSIKTNDELQELGEAFNKMTDGLKQLQALKDEFVFIAAHELKTPVAAIKGYLSIINDGLAGPVSDKVKEFITKVLNANGRLIRLVEDLLEVARSEAGRIKVDVMKTDIAPVVNETLSELKPLSDEKGIKITYSPLQPMPAVLADNGRVREVLVNLIGNSIKYTLPKPDKDNSINVTHEVKDGKLVTHIKDHGLGMSKEAQAKLFTKFYRVSTKETANITGTGLGLFIVKQIIEKMGGTITVDSVEGQGSTFSFSLPLAAEKTA